MQPSGRHGRLWAGDAIAKVNGRSKSIDLGEILTLLDYGLLIRKTAGKLGVSLSTIQRVKMENLTGLGWRGKLRI